MVVAVNDTRDIYGSLVLTAYYDGELDVEDTRAKLMAAYPLLRTALAAAQFIRV